MPNFLVQTRSYVRVPQCELWSHLQKIVKKKLETVLNLLSCNEIGHVYWSAEL